MKYIYAIYDLVAGEIAGPLFTYAADAAAIRAFSDIAGRNDTTIAAHVEDYELIKLGMVKDRDLIPGMGTETILTGRQWRALQEKSTGA